MENNNLTHEEILEKLNNSIRIRDGFGNFSEITRYNVSDYISICILHSMKLDKVLELIYENSDLERVDISRYINNYINERDFSVKPITIDGITYDSVKAAAEAFGIPLSTFRYRYEKGIL